MVREQDGTIYHEVPGGAELLRWFGRVPSFHDAEILSLDLRRNGQSTLRVHGWITTGKVGESGFLVLERQAVVSFALDGIMDLQLDGFSVSVVVMPRRRDCGRRAGSAMA